MGLIAIEFADQIKDEPCMCCGGRTMHLTRFVSADGDPHAVCYAAFSDNHPDRAVSVAGSLGEWGKGATSEDRVAFALRIRPAEAAFQVTVVDAAESQWGHAPFFGRMLDREEALKHTWIKEVFHITGHIVTDAQEVRKSLDGEAE
jgi:hypothetical protein